MKVVLERRAEIALRSLDARDYKSVSGLISRISRLPPRDDSAPEARKADARPSLRLRRAGKGDLFVAKAGEELRVLFSFSGETVIIQDIVPYNRLSSLVADKAA